MSPVGRVADPERHRLGPRLERVLGGRAVGHVERVALGRRGQVHDELGERQRALRQADEVDGLLRGHRDHQRLRVGEPHVLAGEAHQPPRHVERVLAGLQHAREPVEARVRVRVAHRLVQRRDDVEVLLAGLVVEQRLARERLPHGGRVDPRASRSPSGGAVVTASSSTLSAVRASPSEAAGEERERVLVHLGAEAAEPALADRPSACRSTRSELLAPRAASAPRRASATSSAAFTSNEGFSVVAPISTMSPDSTWARARPAAPC